MDTFVFVNVAVSPRYGVVPLNGAPYHCVEAEGPVLSRREDDHDGTDLDAIIEVDRVLVGHADASGRDGLADIFRLVGAVDAVQGILATGIEIKGTRTHRIMRSAPHIRR